MNQAVFNRFFWKEYRTLRSFWISMIVAAVAFLCIATYLQAVNSRGILTELGLTQLPVIAMGMATFYAAGCAASWYANEHEEGGYQFLQSRPVMFRELTCAKAAWLVLSSLGVLVIGLLAGLTLATIAGRVVPANPYWGEQFTVACELAAWAALFSLLTKRTSVAALCGIVAFFFVFLICHALLANVPQPNSNGWQWQPLMFARLMILACVGFAFTAIGRRWLSPQSQSLNSISTAASVWWLGRNGEADQDEFGKLYALQVRQTQSLRRSIMVLAAVFFTLACVTAYALDRGAGPNSLFFGSLFGLGILPVAVGLSAFSADQNSFARRYLCDRGTKPRLFWMSRMRASLDVLVILVIAGAVVACLMFGIGSGASLNWMQLAGAFGAIFVALTGFSVAQYAGLFHTSRIVSTALAVVLTIATLIAAAVLTELHSWGGVIVLTPFITALLWATWIRSRTWLRDADGWRVAWLPASVPWAALLAAATLVICLRTFQFPLIDWPIDQSTVVELGNKAAGWKAEYLAINDKYYASVDYEQTSDEDDGELEEAVESNGYPVELPSIERIPLSNGFFGRARPSAPEYSYYNALLINTKLPPISRDVFSKVQNLANEPVATRKVNQGAVQSNSNRMLYRDSNSLLESLQADAIRRIDDGDFETAWSRLEIAWRLTQQGQHPAAPARGLTHTQWPLIQTGNWMESESQLYDLMCFWAAHKAVTAEQLKKANDLISPVPDRNARWRHALILTYTHLATEECMTSSLMSSNQLTWISPLEPIRFERLVRLNLRNQLDLLQVMAEYSQSMIHAPAMDESQEELHDALWSYVDLGKVQEWILAHTVRVEMQRRMTVCALGLHQSQRETGIFTMRPNAPGDPIMGAQFMFGKTQADSFHYRYSFPLSVARGLPAGNTFLEMASHSPYTIPANTYYLRTPPLPGPRTRKKRTPWQAIKTASQRTIPIELLPRETPTDATDEKVENPSNDRNATDVESDEGERQIDIFNGEE